MLLDPYRTRMAEAEHPLTPYPQHKPFLLGWLVHPSGAGVLFAFGPILHLHQPSGAVDPQPTVAPAGATAALAA